jgi:hypothetical protein
MGREGGSAAVVLAVGLLMVARVASAAGQAVPVEGGPFKHLMEQQLSFKPPPGVDIPHHNFVGKSPKDSAGFQGALLSLAGAVATGCLLDSYASITVTPSHTPEPHAAQQWLTFAHSLQLLTSRRSSCPWNPATSLPRTCM